MIFVTVGTDNHDFTRLVRKMDGIAAKTNERVIIQIGHTNYKPKYAEWFRFESNSRIEWLYKKADVIVTHGGAGSIINTLKNNKIPVVVPRLKAFGEHVNNHQLDLARELERRNKVILITKLGDIEKYMKTSIINPKTEKCVLIKKLKKYLEGLA